MTATSTAAGWPSGIVTGAMITVDGVNGDTSFDAVGLGPITVSGNKMTYHQTGSNSSITGMNTGSNCTINGSSIANCNGEADYTYYGIQQFDAATGTAGPQMDRAGSHNDQMILADGGDAMFNGWQTVELDFSRYGAYEYGVSSYNTASSTPQTNFQFAEEPRATDDAFVFHLSGEGSNSPNGLPGWGLVSTYASTQVVDCSPQVVYCAEIMAVKLDGSNTFYRIAHDQSIQINSAGTEMYYAEPHATPSRDFTHIVWESNWRNSAHNNDAFLVELRAQ